MIRHTHVFRQIFFIFQCICNLIAHVLEGKDHIDLYNKNLLTYMTFLDPFCVFATYIYIIRCDIHTCIVTFFIKS